MPTTTCPSRERLAAFVVGKMADVELEAVAAHVDSCAECQSTLASLDGVADTVVNELREPSTTDTVHEEPACRQMLARAQAILFEAPSIKLGPGLGHLREYELLDRLGSGGMGTVYKAVHTKLKRVVALKVLPAERMNDPAAVARFQREMEAVGKLDHPNIVRAYDAGEVAGTHFLVMEYVEGIDLSRLVKQTGPLPVADACELVRQAAIGLQHAHEHGLVHRDIKPSNLMLSVSGAQARSASEGTFAGASGLSPLNPDSRTLTPVLKLLDLGLARLQSDRPASEELTATDQILGTYDYMAPEQASDTHTVDIRADIYSLGCTLYKLLTGRAPFSGPQFKRAMQKMRAHAELPFPPIQNLRAEVPDKVVVVLDRLLAKDPAARFDTPAQVAEALQPFTSGCDLSRLLLTASKPLSEIQRPASTGEYVASAMTGTSRSGDPAASIESPTAAVATAAVRRRRRLVGGLIAALWDAGTAQLLETFVDVGECRVLTWLADGNTLAALGENGLVRLWDTESGAVLNSLQGESGGGILAPDKRTLATPRTNVMRIWQLDTGRPLANLSILRNNHTLIFSPDGHFSGTPQVERELVYVVQTDASQETFTPNEFAAKYGWKNDPDRVRLVPSEVQSNELPEKRE